MDCGPVLKEPYEQKKESESEDQLNRCLACFNIKATPSRSVTRI